MLDAAENLKVISRVGVGLDNIDLDYASEKGIKVLSYYVSDSDYDREDSRRDFKRMYGNDAEFIDVTSVLSVSKTMNKKFLEK